MGSPAANVVNPLTTPSGDPGGTVGVLGGLGGFVCPVIFGVLLDAIGLWTSTWLFLLVVTLVCLLWLSAVVRRMSQKV